MPTFFERNHISNENKRCSLTSSPHHNFFTPTLLKLMTMTFSESIKEGFGAINHRWQLVLIRVLASVVNLAAFFIIVGIPLFIAIMVAGIELAASNAGQFLASLKDAFERGYVWIAALVLASLLLYAIFAAFVWMYVISGSMGIIARTLENRKEIFRVKLFHIEARRHFTPLANFYLLLGMFMLGAFIVLGVAVGGAVYLSDALKEASSFLGLMLEVILNLFIALAGLFAVYGSMTLGSYGAGAVVLDGEQAWPALKKAVKFLSEHPWGFWGYSFFLTAYGMAMFLLFVIGYPFKLIPIIGVVIMLPYQIASYALGRYLGLSLVGSAFSYYFRNTRTKNIQEEAPGHGQIPPGPVPTAQEGTPGPAQTPPSEAV